MSDFDEVSTDIMNLITSLHYEDKDKEIIKYEIAYVLFKMLESKETFEDDIKALDDNQKERRLR